MLRRRSRRRPLPGPQEAASNLTSAPATPDAAVTFEGWGMRTNRSLPWDDEYQWGSLRSSLEAMRSFDLGPLMRTMVPDVDMLMWRHWVVAFSVRYAVCMTLNPPDMALAECGVGDGMSAFVALRELDDIATTREQPFRFELHLYDSFAAMRTTDLTDAEGAGGAPYEDSSVGRTRANLARFSDSLVWHLGYVPDSFSDPPPSPARLHWLHVDLNSSKPTVEVCKFFLPRLHPRGAILFDDYGDQKFVETKQAIDQFFRDVPGLLLKFATGQALFLNAA